MFCNIREENVIAALDVDNIYMVPISYSHEGMDKQVCKHFGIECEGEPDLSKWEKIVETIRHPEGEVKVAVVGKYTQLLEAYKSINEALTHGGIANKYKVKIKWIDSELLEKSEPDIYLSDVCGILVPGGFGQRGTDGKIAAVKYARENNIPFLGICYGMQMAVIETMQNVCGVKNAYTTELRPNCEPIVGLMTEWEKDGDKQKRSKDGDLGGTMRLGAYECVLRQGSRVLDIYKKEHIQERHRHRYEFNNDYREELIRAGLALSGLSPDGRLVEVIELSDHPWFAACQFHPELKSRPNRAHPLFREFVAASMERKRKTGSEI